MFFARFSKKKSDNTDSIDNSNITGIDIGSSPEPLPPLKNPHVLPTSIDDFQEYHIKVLRRLNKHPVNDFSSGLMTIEVDIPNFIPILLDLKLIRESTYGETLYLLKNDALKAILKKCNLKTSGNKNELIERILKNANADQVKQLDEFVPFYLHTPEAVELIENSYDKFKTDSNTFRYKMLCLIEDGHLNEAYRSICKWRAEAPVPAGIGCDWQQRYYDGIPADQEALYNRLLRTSDNLHATSLAIYCDISGESFDKLHTQYESCSDSHYFKTLQTERNFNSYENCGIEKYRFLATLDEQTCPICGKLDGQTFCIKDKKIGVNCPPMHKGCRCTTVAAFDNYLPLARAARNPITRRSEMIPYVTYSEWIKQYK